MTAGENRIIVGDALAVLRRLPTATADCCVTSVPYFQLRDYGNPGQIGLEPNVQAWADALNRVFREMARVLKPAGTTWLNVGESFSRGIRFGAPKKSLVLAPERLLERLASDGWLIRNKIIWAKPNPMPSSARDRLNTTYEYVYLLARQADYFFDLDAIRVAHRSAGRASKLPKQDNTVSTPDWSGPLAGNNSGLARMKARGEVGHPLGKNPGDVWTIAPARSPLHPASFPEKLAERPIRAGCPERVCAACGQAWRRGAIRRVGHLALAGSLRPNCNCGKGWIAGLVIDPFVGSGTTAVVAERLGRRWLGIELNPSFAADAVSRIAAQRESRAA